MRSSSFLQFIVMAIIVQACNVAELPEQNDNPEMQATEVSQNDKREIEAVLMKQQKNWNDGDIPAFMSGYKNFDGLGFTTSNGLQKGYETVLQRYLKSYPDKEAMGRLEFEILENIPVGNDNALVIGKWTLYRKDDKPGGHFSLLWERTANGWKIIHDHTS